MQRALIAGPAFGASGQRLLTGLPPLRGCGRAGRTGLGPGGSRSSIGGAERSSNVVVTDEWPTTSWTTLSDAPPVSIMLIALCRPS